MSSENERTEVSTFVYADSALVVDTDTSYIDKDEEGTVTWVEDQSPNLILKGGTKFGDWILGESPFGEVSSVKYKLKLAGRCRLMRVILSHSDDKPLHFLGFGAVFKTKKP